MPKVVDESERRVVLNCMIAPGTLTWLKSFSGSQGGAVDYAVDLARAAEHGQPTPIQPRKLSKKAQSVEALAASSNLTAKGVVSELLADEVVRLQKLYDSVPWQE